MEPGNYFNNSNPETEEPKPLHGAERMAVEPSQRDRAKKARYRKFLKIRTLVFGVLAVVFLVIGLPLVIVFKDTRGHAAWALGLLVSIIGGACTLIFLIYLPVFMRVMATRSQTAIYQPRTAEALHESPYPRQVEIPDIPSRPLTATNPNYNPNTDPLLRNPVPETIPTAPLLPPLPTEEPPRYDYIQREHQQ
ncbi:hypothetical protein Aperf_G00000108911 [Anoplocephala perfoliata]